jgi:hypothetical protein
VGIAAALLGLPGGTSAMLVPTELAGQPVAFTRSERPSFQLRNRVKWSHVARSFAQTSTSASRRPPVASTGGVLEAHVSFTQMEHDSAASEALVRSKS